MQILALLLAAAVQGSPSTPNVAAARSAVDSILEAQKPVGAAVGIVKDGTLVYTKFYGLRNVAKHEAVDENTAFNIGSVTKQFTAASILQLQEAGKLKIDDALSNYLPAFPHAHEITLRQMLHQVTGLEDYLGGETPLPIKDLANGGGLEAVAARAKVPLHFKPGTRWEYSNTNYYVLGKVVEEVSGQTYEAYVREHLFAPAGMTHSGFMSDEPNMPDFAVGYWRGLKNNLPMQVAPEIQEGWAGGAGAIVSTLADMAAWNTALRSGKIVSAKDYALMTTPPHLLGNAADTYGMGLGNDPVGGHERIWHNGGSLGSFTMDATYPNDHIDIIVFENSTTGNPDAVESRIASALFPDIAVAEKKPAAGEDLAIRSRVLRILDQTRHGNVPLSEIRPEFAKLATPQVQKGIADFLKPEGAPSAVIYKGISHLPGRTAYRYRVEFAHSALMFEVSFDDKTHLIYGIALRPAQ